MDRDALFSKSFQATLKSADVQILRAAAQTPNKVACGCANALAAWEAEISRRVEELGNGFVKTVPWSDAR